mgnify:CR=1 FL=1
MSRYWNRSQKAETRFWSNKDNYYGYYSQSFWEKKLRDDGLDPTFFSDASVIELGCGPFGLIHYLDSPRVKYGVDPLISTYRDLGLLQDGGVTHLEMQAECIEVPDCSFDIAISYNTLDHVAVPLAYLKEANRILKENGKLYLNVHVFHKLLFPILPALRYIDSPHPWHFSESKVRYLLRKAGFEIEASRRYPVHLLGRSVKKRIGRLIAFHAVYIARKDAPTKQKDLQCQ